MQKFPILEKGKVFKCKKDGITFKQGFEHLEEQCGDSRVNYSPTIVLLPVSPTDNVTLSLGLAISSGPGKGV